MTDSQSKSSSRVKNKLRPTVKKAGLKFDLWPDTCGTYWPIRIVGPNKEFTIGVGCKSITEPERVGRRIVAFWNDDGETKTYESKAFEWFEWQEEMGVSARKLLERFLGLTTPPISVGRKAQPAPPKSNGDSPASFRIDDVRDLLDTARLEDKFLACVVGFAKDQHLAVSDLGKALYDAGLDFGVRMLDGEPLTLEGVIRAAEKLGFDVSIEVKSGAV